MSKHKVMDLVFTGFHKNVLPSIEEIVVASKMVGLYKSGPVGLPTKIKKWTVLRGPFVYKKSQEHYELRVHKQLLRLEGSADELKKFLNFTVDTVDPGATVKVLEKSYHDLEDMYSFSQEKEVGNIPTLVP